MASRTESDLVGQVKALRNSLRAAESIIEADDVGPVALKGLARPVPLWSVRGLR
jgi:class 3 adenylate cyclase